METKHTPVPETQRILSLDVLRGFALLGILTINIVGFSMPLVASIDPTAYGELFGLNEWVWRLTHILADDKFMTIFSMLFGAGIVLTSQRAESRGYSSIGLHYRRMGWLVVFGLLHAHLLWYGDILYWYGMCGMVVFLFRKLSPRRLIVWGMLSIAVTSGIMLAAGATVELWPPVLFEQMIAALKPSVYDLASEIAIYQGGWLEQFEMRTPQAIAMETYNFLLYAGRVGGLMLLGMALFKLGVFNAQRSRRFYLVLIALAILVGIPVIDYGIRLNFANYWVAPSFILQGSQFNYWASLLVSLGWVGAVMLACQKGLTRFTRPLAAIGRTAFSNYILQTLICTTIFYGYGFGLFSKVNRVGQAGIVLAIWVLQLTISPIWLRHFHFGPLEWLWRSLVYMEKQPFRRTMPR